MQYCAIMRMLIRRESSINVYNVSYIYIHVCNIDSEDHITSLIMSNHYIYKTLFELRSIIVQDKWQRPTREFWLDATLRYAGFHLRSKSDRTESQSARTRVTAISPCHYESTHVRRIEFVQECARNSRVCLDRSGDWMSKSGLHNAWVTGWRSSRRTTFCAKRIRLIRKIP